MGWQRGQWKPAAWHCWEGQHGCMPGGRLDPWKGETWTCPGHDDFQLHLTEHRGKWAQVVFLRGISEGLTPFHRAKTLSRQIDKTRLILTAMSNDGEVLNGEGYGWKDRHPPCQRTMALLANTTIGWGNKSSERQKTGTLMLMQPIACMERARTPVPPAWSWELPGRHQESKEPDSNVYKPMKALWKHLETTQCLSTSGVSPKVILGKRSVSAATNTEKLHFYKKVHANSCINTELH